MLYYYNEITGDWTTNLKEAAEWYRNGYAVELNKMDMDTGELKKCAEWVWQRGLTPSAPQISGLLMGRSFLATLLTKTSGILNIQFHTQKSISHAL